MVQVAEPVTSHNSIGTTICVRDIFYQYPVRQRQLIKDSRMDLIKRKVEQLALIHHGVGFSLSLVDDDAFVLNPRHSSLQGGAAPPRSSSKIIFTRSTSLPSLTFRQLFGESLSQGLVQIRQQQRLQQQTQQQIRITGFISSERGHYTKQHQYVYVNGFYIASNQIHQLVNAMCSCIFSSSIDPNLPKGSTTTNIERYPIYLLSITCDPSFFDISIDPAKNVVEFEVRLKEVESPFPLNLTKLFF